MVLSKLAKKDIERFWSDGTKATIIFMIFWDFLMFYQIFILPQVKRYVIITYKHGMYELPQELSNNLRLRILGN